jgi:uncharacterized protein YjiS (DUF1127 family)
MLTQRKELKSVILRSSRQLIGRAATRSQDFSEEYAMFMSFIVERIGSVFRCRRAVRELSTLSDRELWDIGLVRTDVDALTRSDTA